MQRFITLFGVALLLCAAVPGHAATLNVTTTHDEANCRSEAGCSTLPNGSGEHYPNSTGCSLREALQDISSAGGTQPYPECGSADAGMANTINLAAAGGTIVVNALENDPGINGTAPIYYGSLPYIGSAATFGAVTITTGAVSCFKDPQSNDGVIIFHETNDGDATFAGVSFSNCTASGAGIAITNTGSGNLTLTGVTFTNIHATNQGDGGCIAHGSGSLTILGGSFTGCITDDGGMIPGGGNGEGGAISIGVVGGTSFASISGVTFQGNIAGQNGGAIYLHGTDAISISASNFAANIANGNTHDSGNAELGGGAIFASNTATGGNDGSGGLNASDFLIFNTSFIGNLAPNGTGGAIVLAGGNLTYGSASFDGNAILTNKVPGGIIASNFSANIASGTWNGMPVDPRAGSGGAIFARGNLAIIDSSFVGANTSTNASGGAIAFYDKTAGFSPIAISNVTFNGNSAAFRGGAVANLINNGKMTLINNTLSGDSAGVGGGGELYNASSTVGDVNIANTIFDSGTGGNCAGGAFTDVAGNLQHNPASGCASIANSGDPALAGAAPFGGANALVFVMKLNPGSAASGAGDAAICAASPIVNLDAVLNSRPQGKSTCDAGAFETDGIADLSITKSHADPFKQGDSGDTYTITATNSGNDSTSGPVTLIDSLPVAFTAMAMTGTGWSCMLGTLTCTRSDALAASSSYPPITLTVDVSSSAPAAVTNTATVSGGGEVNTSNDSVDDPTNITALADLTIAKTHSDPFTQGDMGDTYTITVSNAAGVGPTAGTVNVVDTLPGGMTATAIAGTGWTCTLGTLTCNRSDALASGASYPAITLTVNVSASAATPVTNSASVSGGGEVNTSNDSVDDSTNITALPDLTIAKMHTDQFKQGATGRNYTITVTNSGMGATSGQVSVTDTLPVGLTATAMSGTGWTCTLGATPTCTSTDVVAGGASYPDITLTVDVSMSTAPTVTNTVVVSGGGEANTSNDSADDLTVIQAFPVTLQSFEVD